MESYIDIHSHILPKIDDGAKNFEMSLKMMDTAWKNGICGIILTPHNKPGHRNASPQVIKETGQRLEEEARQRGMDIRLYAGNEVYYRSGLAEEIAGDRICTMAGSKYVLTEFGPMDDYDYIRNGIYSLMAAGYQPILAHVERYAKVCMKMDRVEELIRMGCCLQVNGGSIMGRAGFSARRLTGKLLKLHLVHFVATDAHDADGRAPEIADCAAFVGRKYGEAYRKELFYENPMRVIRDEYI